MYLHTFKINVIFSSIIAVQSHCDIVTCTCPYRTRSYCASNRSQRAEAWPTVSNLRCAGINENEGKENEQKCEWDRMRVRTDEDEKGWERGRMRVSIYVRMRLNEREDKKEWEMKRVGKKESGTEWEIKGRFLRRLPTWYEYSGYESLGNRFCPSIRKAQYRHQRIEMNEVKGFSLVWRNK